MLMIPSLTQVNDQSFLADDTLIGGYELGGGWLRVERVKIGKRAFVGNSGMAAPGRKVPKASLVAVLSAAPRRKSAHAGESWLGSPPAPLRRTAEASDAGRTYDPPTRLKVARALVEAGRVVPVALGAGLAVAGGRRPGLAARPRLRASCWRSCSPAPLLALAGLVAALAAVAAKWMLVGRHPAGRAPAVELVRLAQRAGRHLRRGGRRAVVRPGGRRHAPAQRVVPRCWAPRSAAGSGARPTGCPETDLVELGDGATVNQGSVVQTHLFHDRMLSMDRVVLKRGATLGPNSVILPAATLGRHATVGPVSLVMRGESVPDKTVWIGNPIGPWAAAE